MAQCGADPAGAECLAVRQTLERVGDRWSALVIASLGQETRRFGELRRDVEGVSQRMLTVTVRNLERDGLVTREAFVENPPRVEYSLTSLGRSLHQTISALATWGSDHMYDVHAARQRYDGFQTVPVDR